MAQLPQLHAATRMKGRGVGSSDFALDERNGSINVAPLFFDRFYRVSAVCILIVASLAKIDGLMHHVKLLSFPDPLLGVPNWCVLLFASIIEITVVLVLIIFKNYRITSLASATLGAEFIAYRLAFNIGHFSYGCPCIGRMGDWLPISAAGLNLVLWFIASWLFVGGIVNVFTSFSKSLK
ncbi:MAG TPA: hypothetical protein VHH88_03655 [Verrucomicrobiae bacterium]|nr:hypothetical protein [Verrucomicrobiae bacterium]